MRLNSARKFAAAFMAGLMLFDVIGVPLAHARQLEEMWTNRRARLAKNPQLAALPAGVDSLPPAANSVIDQLPSVGSTLARRAVSNDENLPASTPAALRSLISAIPQNRATVRDIEEVPGASHAVVLLQDVHMNAEAQLNLAAVIEQLMGRQKIGAIGVEGAARPFDFSTPRKLAAAKFRKELAAEFVKQNMMGVASYVGVSNDNMPPVLGIDDQAHYDANVLAYLTTRPMKKKTQKDLNQLKRAVTEQKAKTFSKELLAFDGLREGYHGVVEKCTFCLQRTRKGLNPACLEACPTGARKFGNLLDPNSEVSAIFREKKLFILKEDLNTLPRFYYYFEES
jgi:ferredoxin